MIRLAKHLTKFAHFKPSRKKVIPLPHIADSISQGTIASYAKKEGEWIEQDETVANVQTDKVSVQIKSPAAGVLTKFYATIGETVAVGKPVFGVDVDASKPKDGAIDSSKREKKEHSKQGQTLKPQQTPQGASKQTKKSSKKQTAKQPPEEQVRQPSKQQPKQPSNQAAKEFVKPQKALKVTQGSQLPAISSGQRKQTRQPISKLRQRLSQRLKQAQNTYALLTTFQQVDMNEATIARKQIGQDFLKKYNVKLGFMSFFLKAATLALQEYPIVNSVIDGNDIVRRNFIDISIAVATPNGLLVPVLRNCQKMKFHDFQIGLSQFAKKGKEGKITLQDLQGGTFTISNGGTFGSLFGTPIINPPQSAILGMHAIVNRPVVRGEEIVARPMMNLALTYDHRLLDGKDAVIFLKRIQSLVQNPKRMLFEV